MGETLLDRAWSNLNYAKKNLTSCEDDAYINFIGYHIQQASELTLKHLLEINTLDYNNTHDVQKLIELIPPYLYSIPDDFTLASGTITSWEYKTRCVKDYFLSLNLINVILPLVENFMLSVSPANMDSKKFNRILSSIPEEDKFKYGSSNEEIVLNFISSERKIDPISILKASLNN